MRGMINNEMVQLANHISLPEGIAMNSSLQENIFALFNCIMNKVPIFICGKPGCSKTLSFELLKDNLQGLKSKDDYFRTLPSIFPIYFQGSLSTTSKEVKDAFDKAKDSAKNLAEIIPVLFFDEMGLAEISDNNPLKILYSELKYDETDKKFAFVGIFLIRH